MRGLASAIYRIYAEIFGTSQAYELATAWRTLQGHPEIMQDLAAMGHLNEPDIDDAGLVLPAHELAFRAGKKAVVLGLIARIGVDYETLNRTLEGKIDDEIFNVDDDSLVDEKSDFEDGSR